MQLVLCRLTQLSLLRLLTTKSVMGPEVLDKAEAWNVCDTILQAKAAVLMDEPYGLEKHFRTVSARHGVAPKTWMDSYLAAFASRLRIPLVTMDRALAATTPGSILLSE